MKRDVVKLLRDKLSENPDMKKKMDEDETFKQDRKNHYVENGCSEAEALKKAWEDYWKMVKERDGVEFGIYEIR